MDLRSAGSLVLSGWQRLHRHAPLVWLTPSVPVILVQADGSDAVWRDGAPASGTAAAASASCVAVEVPDDLLLRRQLTLPALSDADLAGAIELDVQSVSPFGPSDVVFGHDARANADGSVQVEVAIASRRQVEQFLATQSDRLARVQPKVQTPEVWARSARNTAIVFRGFGEEARQQAGRKKLWGAYAMVFCAIVLLGGVLLTPTAQLRLRAVEAVNAYDKAVAVARPVVAQREELLKTTEQLNALAEILQGRIEPLKVIERLTHALPDDAALQTFKLQGNKVTIVGQTGNSSALMQVLSEQPGIRDVKAPTAATRMPGTAKETFVIEFALDPQQYGVALAQTAVQPAAGTASAGTASDASPPASSTAPPTPVQAGTSAAPPPPVAAPPVPARAAAPSGGATFGGATFGGAPAASPGASAPAGKGSAALPAAKP